MAHAVAYVDIFGGAEGGKFSYNSRYYAGRYPTSGAVADLNGDGWDDVIVTSIAGENVVVLLNQGR